MRIDSHVHVWTLGAPPYTHNDDMSTQRPKSPSLVENLIRYMDLNQIDRTVLIQCMYHGYGNSYLCHCLRRFPDRLHGWRHCWILVNWSVCIDSMECRTCGYIRSGMKIHRGCQAAAKIHSGRQHGNCGFP